MQKLTISENFMSTNINLGNFAKVSKNSIKTINSLDSVVSSKKDFHTKDMINLLEIKTNTKKFLHAPSLRVFIRKKYTKTPQITKKKMYMLLRIWKKMAREIPFALTDFENIYFDNKNDVVYLNFDHTGLYSFKVSLLEFHRVCRRTR